MMPKCPNRWQSTPNQLNNGKIQFPHSNDCHKHSPVQGNDTNSFLALKWTTKDDTQLVQNGPKPVVPREVPMKNLLIVRWDRCTIIRKETKPSSTTVMTVMEPVKTILKRSKQMKIKKIWAHLQEFSLDDLTFRHLMWIKILSALRIEIGPSNTAQNRNHCLNRINPVILMHCFQLQIIRKASWLEAQPFRHHVHTPAIAIQQNDQD